MLTAEDELISSLFATECWTDSAAYFARKPVRRFCVSDEHYVPTLVAFHGEVVEELKAQTRIGLLNTVLNMCG